MISFKYFKKLYYFKSAQKKIGKILVLGPPESTGRSLRAFSGGPSLLLLHLLQDGHLYQYLIDLVLGEALEDIRALGVIQRLLRRSLLLKVLKVAYTILLNVYVLPECIRHALRTLVLCLSEQLLWIELGLRLGNASLRAA